MARKAQASSPRAKLTADLLAAVQADFAAHGRDVIEKMRQENPVKYAELASKLIAAEADPANPNSLKDANSMRDIGERLLRSVGLSDPDEAAIQAAIEANDTFVARLQAIAQASGVNPETMN
jgi:hypothetical protein